MHPSSSEALVRSSADARAQLAAALSGPPARGSSLRMIMSGVRTRADIARETGLDTATITRAISALVNAGIVAETTQTQGVPGMRGRPSRVLQILEENFWAIGLHVGVHGVVASAIGLGGSSLTNTVEHHDGTEESAIDACLRGITAIQAAMASAPLGIGVAVGGRVDSAAGTIVEMPRLGWTDVAIADRISRASGLPCTVRSMAQAQAQANVVYGQVDAHESFGHLYIGYIVEFAVVIDGEVWAPLQGHTGAVDSLLLRAEDGTAETVRELVSDDSVIDKARAKGLISSDESFEGVLIPTTDDPRIRGELKLLLEARARSVGDLIVQLQEVIALPTVVLSASMARQPDAVDLVRDRVQQQMPDRAIPRILTGGPVELANPRSAACGYFESILAEVPA